MSRTEFEHIDGDGDELRIRHDPLSQRPLMLYAGRRGVEMFRPDVERLHAYLGAVLAEVPAEP